MKKRLSLDELEITSFVTNIEPTQTHLFAGGATATCVGSGCPDICATIRGTKCMTDEEEPVLTQPIDPEEEQPITI
ncbi:MAG: pinensin family lanthipeptide [Cyclobacteriaceae bacterium]